MKSFRIGGIHPPENKLSAGKAIETLPLPEKVYIPLSQHLGAPAVPVVQRGDEVKVGTLLAKSNGFISANIHSSVSGKVSKIDSVMTSSGYKQEAIWIDVRDDVWEDGIDRSDDLIKECNLSGKEIIEKIENAGLVGLGGATFPAHIKLMSAVGKADSLLINASECEPYLTDDHALMLAKAQEILIGTTILMKASGVKKAYIGIENNKKDAIRKFSEFRNDYPNIDIVPLRTQYPQGGEKQLIDAILKRRVPSGKLPSDVGCVVQNVGTVFAAYEAVQKNKPLIDRLVTVTGKSLKNPVDLRVRIGTMASELINFVGGLPEDTGKIIAGGPMMGRALSTPEIPITKGISGILMLPESESMRKPSRACIRCGKCVSVCPMALVPSSLMTFSKMEDWDKAAQFNICDCIECSSCTYSCPSNRPLLDYIRLGKSTVLTRMRNSK
jgi:electron transport complex, RnfABCDGE type, C subunit